MRLDVLTWQSTLASEDGPDDYTMRLALLALSAMMLRAGACPLRVTTTQIATASGLTRQWVSHLLRKAIAAGWLNRAHPLGQGRAWQCFEYAPSLPDQSGDVDKHVERGTKAFKADWLRAVPGGPA